MIRRDKEQNQKLEYLLFKYGRRDATARRRGIVLEIRIRGLGHDPARDGPKLLRQDSTCAKEGTTRAPRKAGT